MESFNTRASESLPKKGWKVTINTTLLNNSAALLYSKLYFSTCIIGLKKKKEKKKKPASQSFRVTKSPFLTTRRWLHTISAIAVHCMSETKMRIAKIAQILWTGTYGSDI